MRIKLLKGKLCIHSFGADVTRQKTANDTIPGIAKLTRVLKKKKKKEEKHFFAVSLGKVHMTRAGDTGQTNVTGHEPPPLSNEIK